jgi:hypothetical protein
MKKPILACAGRTSVSIDAELLNDLLLSYTPNYIGIRAKASSLITELEYLRDQDGNLEMFKDIITREFLSMQLIKAAQIARKLSAEAVAAEEPDLGAL